jgi:predicted MPP superfamily phosphohydrolase
VRFLFAVIAIFVPLNVAAFLLLVRVHPKRRALIIALTVIGNLMWLFLPLLNVRNDFSRASRALLAPPWFAWQCFGIIYSAFMILVAIAWLLFARRKSFASFANKPSFVYLTLLTIGSVVGVYQCLVPLRIERVPITLANLPPELEGKHIALLGDLHVGLFSRSSRLETIFATASGLNPDVIILAGDSIDDDPHYVPKLLAATRAANSAIPIVAVLGNHEMYGSPFEVIAMMRNSRIRLLVNEGYALGKLWIAGLSDYAARDATLKPNLAAALAQKPAGAFPIVVAHQPKAFADAKAQHVALTLAAHTHGGQLGIRPLGWSLPALFVKYHMGLYVETYTQLYVNTGTGFWVLPFRLGMTPEITLIELRKR